ncbi:MAG: hypothetical protein ACO20H_06825 [Bacteriovoracaceae bacterium]
MNLQDSIIKSYKELFGKRTLSSISKHTGLNISRLFRIFNGAKMRLDEYEIFRCRILETKGHMFIELEPLMLMLDNDEAHRVRNNLERKLKKKKLIIS